MPNLVRIGLAAAAFLLSSIPATVGAIDVTRFDDPPLTDTSGVSLRQAVILANATPGSNLITLQAGTYRLTLRGDDATAEAGDLDITGSVMIHGDPAGETVIDARKAKDRAFEVLPGGGLTLFNVTVQGGNTSGDGGAVFSAGMLSIESSTFTKNKAHVSGGAIASEGGTATLFDVVVTKNKAVTNDGGGLEFDVGGSAMLMRVTVSHNKAGDTGGGIDTDNGVDVTLDGCTVSNNKSRHEGGGLDPSAGTLTISNSTISGNKSAKGGGIQLEDSGVVILHNDTIAFNKAKEGAGLWTEAGSSTTLDDTIVAKNKPFDCFGGLVSNGSNLIGRSDGCTITGDTTGNIVGGPKPAKPVDPKLGPLADNGGTTQTHALLPGSPAIDAVVGTCPPPSSDQRSMPRTGTCDIGAFEVQ